MAGFNLMAIVMNHRRENAKSLQDVMTKYGCEIKVRLGLHEAGDVCSDNGLIVLQLTNNDDEIKNFEAELNALAGINAKLINMPLV